MKRWLRRLLRRQPPTIEVHLHIEGAHRVAAEAREASDALTRVARTRRVGP